MCSLDLVSTILVSFCGPYGRILEAFWAHLEVRNRLGGSIGAPFVSELDLDSSTPAILEDFGGLWGRFFEIFLNLFWI